MMYFAAEDIPAVAVFLEERMPRYLSILERMVGINSFTGNPEGVNRLAAYTEEVFASLGFKAERVDSAQGESAGKHLVLTREGKSGVRIGCVSHLDTVFTEEEEKSNNFVFRVEGGRVYGPGTNDIKGGTVVMLMMLEAIREFAPEAFDSISWVLLFDATEETESEDFGELCLNRIGRRGLACLIFEGGNIRNRTFRLVVARKGRAVFKILARGRAAHSGVAHDEGANAIVQLADAIRKASELSDYESGLTVNIGRVDGGIAINRVPHYAEAEGEMRSHDPDVLRRGLERLKALEGLSTVASADGSCKSKVEIELIRTTTAWPENRATMELFNCFVRAADRMNMKAEAEARGGLSDGNYIWSGLPTLDGLGPDGENAHCSERDAEGSRDQEYALLSSFVPKAMLSAIACFLLAKNNDRSLCGNTGHEETD